VNNQAYTLDETDRKIIGILAGDSRLSYERIGSALNLTRNSIKTRVNRMVSIGVIQEYIADINLSVLGYNVYYVITKQRKKGINAEINHIKRSNAVGYLDRLGDILAEIKVLGESSIFRIATREALPHIKIAGKDHEVIDANSELEAGLIEKVVLASTAKGFKSRTPRKHQRQEERSFLTPTDLKILRSLVLNPKIGVTDIANLISVSARTANRILNKLIDNGVVRFSIICDPSLMKGLVVFGLLIYVDDNNNNIQGKKKSLNSHKVLERLYSDSQEFPFLRTPIISHDNIVIMSVFGSDVSAIDSIFKRILSFEEVKKVELYVFTRIKYYKESIAKKIDNILGSRL
jgi:DNA-binding Lrp family transcriptional regulator